jgi:enediyne biosynthesis protein E4
MEVRRPKLAITLLSAAAVLMGLGHRLLPVAPGQSPPGSSSVRFIDITGRAGIKFVHFKGNNGISINREEFGPGVCVGDFDGDGWQDIYFVNGRDLYDRGISVRNALYRNNRDGTFTDVTDKAGVQGTGYGLGCVWGDYDNDGFPDLFVTQYGRNVLYHNNRNGTFTDVTEKAGVAGLESGTFHSGATFFDYDRDGFLDLYVGSYVALEPGPRYCNIGTIRSSCPPSAYKGSLDALYHNNGDGTFTNVTRAMNISQPRGKNLSVGAADYDNDGWPDLFVANDGVEAYLYHNRLVITTTTAGSTCMFRIFRDLRTTPGTMTNRAISTSRATRWGLPRQHTMCLVSAGVSSTMTTTAGLTCSSPTAMFIPKSNKRLPERATSR